MGKQSGGGARTGFGIGRNAEGGQMGFAANISQRARLAQATTAAMRAGQTRIQRLPSTTEGDQGATIARAGRNVRVNPRNAMTPGMVRVNAPAGTRLPPANRVGQYQFAMSNGSLRGYSPRTFAAASRIARQDAARSGSPAITFRGTI